MAQAGFTTFDQVRNSLRSAPFTKRALCNLGSLSRPLVERSPRVILNGIDNFKPISSWDPIYLTWLQAYVGQLREHLPVDLNDDLTVGSSGVGSDFAKLLVPAGYGQAPMSYPTIDNKLYVKSLGLPDAYRSPRHETIYTQLWRIVFNELLAKPLRVPKLSSAGSPLFHSHAGLKRQHALHVLAHAEELFDLNCSRQFERLFRQHAVAFLYSAGRRDQLDAPDKVRKVFTREYAVSGGKQGGTVDTDKTVIIDGVHYKGLGAARTRLFRGAPFAVNVIIQVLASGHMKSLFKRYASTFYTDVPSFVAGVPLSERICCLDISNYDTTMSQHLIDTMLKVMEEYWGEGMSTWVRRMLMAPTLTRAVETDGKPFLLGDPCDPGEYFSGNPSGIALTSLIAKVMCVGNSLCIIDSVTHDVAERVDDYLAHRNVRLRILNEGDDTAVVGEPELVAAFLNAIPSGYFVMESERGNIFKGYLITKGTESWLCYNRLAESQGKILVPERSAGSNFRPYPSIGWIARLGEVNNPSHSRMMELFHRTWRQHMSPHFGDLFARLSLLQARVPLSDAGLTDIDRLVMDDPALLYHRYSEDDVSPHVLAQIFASAIQPSEYEPVLDFYRGIISE